MLCLYGLVEAVRIKWYPFFKCYRKSPVFRWDDLHERGNSLRPQVRLSFTSRGNKTESMEPFIKGTILSAVAAVAYVYYLRLQTWVLHVEVILNSIGLVSRWLGRRRSAVALTGSVHVSQAFVGVEMCLSTNTMLNIYWEQNG